MRDARKGRIRAAEIGAFESGADGSRWDVEAPSLGRARRGRAGGGHGEEEEGHDFVLCGGAVARHYLRPARCAPEQTRRWIAVGRGTSPKKTICERKLCNHLFVLKIVFAMFR